MYFEVYDKLKEYILRNPEGLEDVTKEELADIELIQREVHEYEYSDRD